MIFAARTAKNFSLKRALSMLSCAAMPCRNEGTPQRHRILEKKKGLKDHKLIGLQKSK